MEKVSWTNFFRYSHIWDINRLLYELVAVDDIEAVGGIMDFAALEVVIDDRRGGIARGWQLTDGCGGDILEAAKVGRCARERIA